MQTFQPLYTNHPPQPELSLEGPYGYRLEKTGRVDINIHAITNSRDANCVSGTLSVELWALKQPYKGGHFEGIALAGTQIGEIYDQHSLKGCHYNLCFQEPPTGTWHLSLMLREWDGTAYTTRDFVNFNHAYVVNWKPVKPRSNPDTNTTPQQSRQPQEPAASVTVTSDASAPETASSKKAATKTQAVSNAVNINTANLKEIAALKGISGKVAEAIITERPFRTIDALLKVKGFGKKTLDKLKGSITL